MRILSSTLIAGLLVVCATANGQNGDIFANRINGPGPTAPVGRYTSEQYRLVEIKHILSSPNQIGSVQLARMGDRAAVYISEILQSRAPLSPTEQYRVVDMLHRAFEKPAAISPSGRQTVATMALLKKIEDPTSDFSLRLRIADARALVLASGY